MGKDPRVANLERDVASLRRRMEQRPVLQTIKGAADDIRLIVIGGNTVPNYPSGGILYSETEITEVPTAYDPNVDTTFIDGIGRGYLYVNGVPQADKVLIVNDPRGLFGAALILDDGTVAGDPVSIPVTGTGSVRAYIVG